MTLFCFFLTSIKKTTRKHDVTCFCIYDQKYVYTDKVVTVCDRLGLFLTKYSNKTSLFILLLR